jgi:F-type H+-transporting ATPase subunit a
MAATGLHISLAAEPVFTLGGLVFTNSMFTSVIVSSLLILFAILVNRSLKKTNKPTGLQNFGEWIIESLYNLVHSITGDLKKTSLFFPFIATFFLFILLNNWFGLLPGVGTIMKNVAPEKEAVHVTTESPSGNNLKLEESTGATHEEAVDTEHGESMVAVTEDEHAVAKDEHVGTETATEAEHTSEEAGEHHPETVPLLRAGTADLNMTIALGIVTMILVQLFGVKFLHVSYFTKFFNFSSPIMFFVGILELISEVGKILSFGFRLFGNVFAGEVLLVVIMSLAGVVVPMPFYALEIFVGFIQALVFAMLSLVFFNMATLGHGEHD